MGARRDMRNLVFHSSKRLHSEQDEKISSITDKALLGKSQRFSLREYGSILGWLLSLFNLTFRVLDNHGAKIWVGKRQFCKLILSLNDRSPKARELDEVMLIFKKEINELSYSSPEETPELLAFLHHMSDSLQD